MDWAGVRTDGVAVWLRMNEVSRCVHRTLDCVLVGPIRIFDTVQKSIDDNRRICSVAWTVERGVFCASWLSLLHICLNHESSRCTARCVTFSILQLHCATRLLFGAADVQWGC